MGAPTPEDGYLPDVQNIGGLMFFIGFPCTQTILVLYTGILSHNTPVSSIGGKMAPVVELSGCTHGADRLLENHDSKGMKEVYQCQQLILECRDAYLLAQLGMTEY